MALVSIPKDISNIKTKFVGNFTKRQCVCFGLGIVVGVPIFFLTAHFAGRTAGFYTMIIIMMPFFLFGVYQKNGMPLERYLKFFLLHRFINPPIRRYKTVSIYDYIGGKEEAEKNATDKKESDKKCTDKRK